MGYKLTRFAGGIDKEFHCSICSMVLVNPVETPCGHVFCNDCVTLWISENATCPTDRTPLSQTDLKPPNRLFINALAKLKINCDFKKEGCKKLVELGQLQHHLTICKFNPNPGIIRDKGCNKNMRRRADQTHDGLVHLSNLNENNNSQIETPIRQDEQIANFKKMAEENNLKLKGKIRQLKGKMTNVICEYNFQTRELTSLTLTMIRQEQENKKLEKMLEEKNEDIRRLTEQLAEPQLIPKWRIDRHLSFLEESNTLESNSDSGTAQSNYSLSPESSHFKIKILSIPTDGEISIGLAPKDDHLTYGYSIYFKNTGSLRYFEKSYFIPEYGVGDVIEFGIKYPENFNENQSQVVVAYYKKNGHFVHGNRLMLIYRLFPTIEFFETGTKVKVHYNVPIKNFCLHERTPHDSIRKR